MAQLLSAVAGKRVLFLYGESGGRAIDAARPLLEDLVRSVPTRARGHLEVRVVPEISLVGFRSLDAQRVTVDAVIGWMEMPFSPANGPAVAGRDVVGL
jgi:hypothetical protein